MLGTTQLLPHCQMLMSGKFSFFFCLFISLNGFYRNIELSPLQITYRGIFNDYFLQVLINSVYKGSCLQNNFSHSV